MKLNLKGKKMNQNFKYQIWCHVADFCQHLKQSKAYDMTTDSQTQKKYNINNDQE